MKLLPSLLSGILLGAACIALLWYGTHRYNFSVGRPPQKSFETERWKASGAAERGMMHEDLVRILQKTRPSLQETRAMLGEPAYDRNASLNNAETCLVYNYDRGQRILGFPFLNKLGVSFDKNGKYSDVTSWD